MTLFQKRNVSTMPFKGGEFLKFREMRLKAGEFRTQVLDDGKLTVSGYVNLTGQFSDPLSLSGDEVFVETIESGVFDRAIKRAIEDGKDIDFLVEHDHEKILASTRNNSLFLQEDEHGLYMSSIIVPTTYGKDFYQLMKNNIIQNFSFGFRVIDEEWDFNSDPYMRVVKDLELFEVSAVRYPAYPQSFIDSRGLTPSDDILEVRRLEAMEENKGLEVREESGDEEVEEEEASSIDVAGSIIAIDQRMGDIEDKLDEVLSLFLDKRESDEEQEEQEVKEEKMEEEEESKEEKKEDLDSRDNEEDSEVPETEEEEAEETRDDTTDANLEINKAAVDKLKQIIQEFDTEEE